MNEEVTIQGELRHETDAAILIRVEEEEVWLPKSQIDWPEDAETGDEIDIVIPEWLADDKGL